MGKQRLPRRGLIYWLCKFVLATLVKGHHMIIYANLHSNLSISIWGEDYQSCNIHYNRKNGPAPIGASFTDRESSFSSFGKKSLDDHFCQSTGKGVH